MGYCWVEAEEGGIGRFADDRLGGWRWFQWLATTWRCWLLRGDFSAHGDPGSPGWREDLGLQVQILGGKGGWR